MISSGIFRQINILKIRMTFIKGPSAIDHKTDTVKNETLEFP
jgi:hypothetical protein